MQIPRKNSQCCHQGERLLPGMEIYSLLIEDQNKKHFIRKDFCSACWPHAKKEERSYWKSKIEQRKVKGKKGERALALLHDFPSASPELFVLCLFLCRARKLALRQELQRESETYQVYEVLGQDELITVKVISFAEIERVQKSLADQLNAK